MPKDDREDEGLREEIFAPRRARARKPRRPWASGTLLFLLVPSLVGALLCLPASLGLANAVASVREYWQALPADETLDVPLPGRTTVLTRDGVLMATFYEENRVPLEREEIPQDIVDALVATEDASFFDHGGIDLRGLLRSAASTILGRSQGGSTITAQLVQNLDGLRGRGTSGKTEDRSIEAKIEEFKRATSLEQTYTKDEILTAYLNTVYFGNGAYGLGAAAWTYFGLPAADLDTAQAALLVGLLKGPGAYDPFVHPEKAQARRDTVLDRMVETGYLTQAQANDLMDQPLGAKEHTSERGCHDSPWPYYCSLVRAELLDNEAFGETEAERHARYTSGEMTLTVAATSTDLDAAQASITDILGQDNPFKAALAVVEPGTGGVLAVAQNTTWSDTQVVLADSPQQTGSSFKPITLAAALEDGYTLDTVLDGTAPYTSTLDNPRSGSFGNADGAHGGEMDAREAMRISNNIYFVRLTEKVGVKKVAAMANRLGLHLPTNLTGREASITLGSYESTPLEMASVYATFASGGITCDPVFITEVVDNRTGDHLPAPDAHCRRTLDGAVAADVSQALTLPFTEGGTAAKTGGIGRPVIGKTGSTNGWSVAWFAGAVPQEAAAMWIADPTGPNAHPLRNVRTSFGTVPNGYAGALAAPVWTRVMKTLVDGLEVKDLIVSDEQGVYLITPAPPDLDGMTLDAAVTAALDQGLDVMVSTTHAALAPFGPGVVASTSVSDGVVTLTTTPGTDVSRYAGQRWSVGQDGLVRATTDGAR